jgi:hypothetical protein
MFINSTSNTTSSTIFSEFFAGASDGSTPSASLVKDSGDRRDSGLGEKLLFFIIDHLLKWFHIASVTQDLFIEKWLLTNFAITAPHLINFFKKSVISTYYVSLSTVFNLISRQHKIFFHFDILEKVHKNGKLTLNRKKCSITARNDYCIKKFGTISL